MSSEAEGQDWHPSRAFVEAEALKFLIGVKHSPAGHPYTLGGPGGLWSLFAEIMADAAAGKGPGVDWASSVRLNTQDTLVRVAGWITDMIASQGGFPNENRLT
jgi:hypothetical protein